MIIIGKQPDLLTESVHCTLYRALVLGRGPARIETTVLKYNMDPVLLWHRNGLERSANLGNILTKIGKLTQRCLRSEAFVRHFRSSSSSSVADRLEFDALWPP